VVDDPCTACEKARCSNPVNKSDLLLAAYEVCFLGTGVPAAAIGPVCPTDPSSTALTAANGPMAGTAKTNLCQALLKCVHQMNCTGGIDVDNQTACYCGTAAGGAAISLNACESPTFVPTGACVQQVAAALEVSQFSVSAAAFSDPCLANGAAFVLYDFCDANCCEQECGMAVSGYEDPTYCNVPGSGGSGSGGASATGGSTGSGGKGGSGGAAGASGSGGTPATGGVLGSGGSTGGSPGTGGSPATGGSLQLQNVQFDADTAGWTASFGSTIARSPMDAVNKSQSGSLDLHLAAGDPTLSVEVAASQCVSTTGGAMYSLAVSILVPAGSSSAGALGLWFYASNDCSGPIAGSATTPSSATNAWQKVTGSAQAPAGAHSMAVRLEVVKPLGQTTAEALFDAVSVSGP
jgi:hypothetical protein